jgi:hypothetical protein
LEQSRQEFGAGEVADTLCNLIVAYQYQSKPTEALVQQLKATYPDHFLANKKGLVMVEGAFERESVKFKVLSCDLVFYDYKMILFLWRVYSFFSI